MSLPPPPAETDQPPVSQPGALTSVICIECRGRNGEHCCGCAVSESSYCPGCYCDGDAA